MLLYGLAFLVPELLPDVAAVELTLGRYLVYGALSLVLLARLGRAGRTALDRDAWRAAALLALFGNAGYYLLVVIAVQQAGAPVTALIVGALPVTLAVAGSWGNRRRLMTLGVPLLLTVAGLALVNGAALGGAPDGTTGNALLGVSTATTALACWTVFGVVNARFLARRPDIGGSTWASVLGVATLIWMLPGLTWLLLTGDGTLSAATQPGAFLIGALILGVGTSWVATALWNRAAVRLPIALAGQLVVVETVAGTAYSYAHRLTVPELPVLAGAALLIGGALLAVRRVGQSDTPELTHARKT